MTSNIYLKVRQQNDRCNYDVAHFRIRVMIPQCRIQKTWSSVSRLENLCTQPPMGEYLAPAEVTNNKARKSIGLVMTAGSQ